MNVLYLLIIITAPIQQCDEIRIEPLDRCIQGQPTELFVATATPSGTCAAVFENVSLGPTLITITWSGNIESWSACYDFVGFGTIEVRVDGEVPIFADGFESGDVRAWVRTRAEAAGRSCWCSAGFVCPSCHDADIQLGELGAPAPESQE